MRVKCRGGLGFAFVFEGVTIGFSRRTPFSLSTKATREETFSNMMAGVFLMG